MTAHALSAQTFYIFFIIFFLYFVLLTIFYLFLALIGLFERRKRAMQSEDEDYSLIYLSSATIPVSIVLPAHNEELWIYDSLSSILNLNYPKFEVIVVDDCSRDKTLEILDRKLELRQWDVPYLKHFKDGNVRETYKSNKYPNVTVISKSSGNSKAGAINAGLNLAKYDYICTMDADTILEPDALIKVMAHIEREPDKIIGVGSYFGLVNGLKIKDGKIVKKSFSLNPILAYQNLEYIRSFIGTRIAWSAFNAMPVLAGGFAMWKRDVLYELGGFSADFTCEDIELTFRAHDYIAKSEIKGIKILMLPYHVGWTEGPSNIIALISQRERWQRVTNETIWKYKYMLCNIEYGAFAFLAFPYFVLYEVLGAFFEVASVAFVTAGWLLGVLDIRVFEAFLCLMLLSQTFISLLSLLSFIRGQRAFRLSYVIYLIVLSFFEFFLYRWILAIAKLWGTYRYFTGIKTFESYSREKRT